MREYLIYAAQNGFLLERKWFVSLFTSPLESNEYVERTEKGWSLLYGDKKLFVSKDLTSSPVKVIDYVTFEKGDIRLITEKTKTTIGTFMENYLLLEHSFSGRVPYQNKQFSFNSIAPKYIYPYVTDNPTKPGDISVKELVDSVAVISFIRTMSSLFVTPSTEDSMYPPDEVFNERDRLRKVYVDKYGKDWYSNRFVMLEYEETMMKWVKNYYKNDPTMGITMDKKALASYKKKYISIGVRQKMIDSDDDVNAPLSLSEGQDTSKKQFAAMANNIIFGSSSRALTTVIAGVMTKEILTAVHSFKVSLEDCKTKDREDFYVEEFFLEALQYLEFDYKGKVYDKTKGLEQLIGKTIQLRIPVYCKAKGDTYCKKCCGEAIALNENSLVLLFAKLVGDNLNFQLSKFHGVDYVLKEFTIDETIL